MDAGMSPGGGSGDTIANGRGAWMGDDWTLFVALVVKVEGEVEGEVTSFLIGVTTVAMAFPASLLHEESQNLRVGDSNERILPLITSDFIAAASLIGASGRFVIVQVAASIASFLTRSLVRFFVVDRTS
jgi:hypothetical protein